MKDDIYKLFQRYEDGSATPEERTLVESWYESHYGQQGKKLSRNDETAVFDDLDSRISSMLAHQTIRRRLNHRWLQIAAILVAAVASVLFLGNKQTKKKVLSETFTEIRSLNGVKKEVTLSDGTTVFLNSGSSIFVSSRFGEKMRKVKLSGEAFFSVRRDIRRPFIIHTGKLQTTVLGTSFDIRAYPDDKHVKVSVATGKVRVEQNDSTPNPAVYAKSLTRNQALVYNTHKGSHVLALINIDSVSSWRSNHLNFDNASYDEIARMLERWYNLKITLEGDIDYTKRYTLSFHNERPDKVLNVLSVLSGLSYTMKGRTVTIHPKY